MTDQTMQARFRALRAMALAFFISLPVLAVVQLRYPPATRGDHIDHYHGIAVPDPYRWMEDIDSPQTRTWVEAQDKLSSDYLTALPHREEIARRLKRIWNFERWNAPEKYGSNWFYTHNDGLQNQAVLFVTTDPASKGRLLLDPNTLSADGTVSLRSMAISSDGRLLAYALSDGGSDWQIWHVRDVASGADLPDTLRWSKAGEGSWLKDGSGFYYTLYDAPRAGDALKAANQYEKLYLHKLGTPQSQDELTYTRSDDPDWFVGGQVTDDGRYLVIEANHGDEVQNTLLLRDLAVPAAPIKTVIGKPTAVYNFIGNIGSRLFVLTDDGAPRYRLIAIDLARPDAQHWHTVVPEGRDTLAAVSLVGGQLIAQYLKDAHSAILRYAPDGKLLGSVLLPGLGTAQGFAGHVHDDDTYYSYSDYTTPTAISRLDLKTGKTSLWHAPQLSGFEPSEFETLQTFYASADGTRVPMFITARRGLKRDGNLPTLLYGYGGFNIAIQPSFSPAIAAWIERGAVYAVANLRGGGEYGRDWHEAGMKTHKQHVFDDCIAAAEYLIAQRWTNPKRLAISGRSNGGLLVGAVEEQRPELFAAALPQVGVLDMLRFRDFTVGKGWESDYGSVDNEDEFKALLAYSPYQNVKSNVDYPATLITTGDHDDRVFPAHSFKFAAAMQHAHPQGKPILIRIETRAGHGQGKPTTQQINEAADVYAFALNAMGL
jgi:prolyl oligopeptidase